MNVSRLSTLLLPVFLLFGPLAAAEAEFRVATVDVNRVMNETKEAQATRKKFDDSQLAAKKKVEQKRATLKKLEDQLKQKQVAEDSKEAEDFRAQARDFARLVRDSEEDLRKEFLKMNRTLTEKTLGIVRTYAGSKGYDLVLDNSSGARGPVLFASDSRDITDEIIRELNSAG